MSAKRFFTHPLGVIGSAVVTTFLWGSAFPFIKLSYEHLHIGKNEIWKQMIFAGYRFFLASLLILVFFTLIGRKLTFKRDTFFVVGKVGLFQTFLQYVLFYIGLSFSTGVQGSIIAGTTSFFQLLAAHFMYKNDRLTLRKIVGVTVGFVGVIIVNITKGTLSLHLGIGEILLLIAMAFGGYGNVLAKEAAKKVDVAYLTAYQMMIGSIGLLLIGGLTAGFFPFHFDVKTFGMLVYLSLLSSVGFILWNNVMKYNQVGKVSMYLFLVPVFGVILSSLMLNEVLSYLVFIGLMMVTSGIIIVNYQKDQRSTHMKSAS
ncbi:DMT family transporter [Bacillus sp. AFS041924]|uniref:DMT family transporter n=1 Tax=Bacillus sp. AFS041924 TaxID=2033503 RepID=UPI000BFDFC3F|nr:DMT family transporter [Bacillus sp. AFS041924]PGS56000.1 EamA family transporter [Bacillus sp. AFS041924]